MERPTAPLSRTGLALRLVAGALVLGGVTAGTFVGTDRWWPFAPMNQYAFTVPTHGRIESRYLMAQTVDGQVVRVPLGRPLGLERAELEGQLGRFVGEPSMLQAIAVLYHRRHPDAPPYTRIWLRDDVTRLPARTMTTTTLATWTVVDPEHPKDPP